MGDGATLEGTTWVLDRTSIEDLAPGTPADARVDLILEDDAVAGTSSWDHFGSYEVGGKSSRSEPSAAPRWRVNPR